MCRWCGPCRSIAPVFESLAKDNGDKVTFIKVDVDDNETTAGNASIRSVPTFIAFQDGKNIHEFSGASTQTLNGMLEKLIQHPSAK